MKKLPLLLCIPFMVLLLKAQEVRYATMMSAGPVSTNFSAQGWPEQAYSATNELTITPYETAELINYGTAYGGNVGQIVTFLKDGHVFQAVGAIVAGPATFRLYGVAGAGSDSPNMACYATIKITPGAFPPDRTVLVPPGSNSVAVAMEQSTNLRDWSPATNGIYGGSDIARFFRIKLQPAP